MTLLAASSEPVTRCRFACASKKPGLQLRHTELRNHLARVGLVMKLRTGVMWTLCVASMQLGIGKQ